MFSDYYSILEVDEKATEAEIKAAFKKQALKWHPDKNPGVDTTYRMQLINEAYLILKDPDARERFDKEYLRFKEYQRQKEQNYQKQRRERENEPQEPTSQNHEKTGEYDDYAINDDILKKWMDNAKKQAVDLAKKTIEDLAGMTKAGGNAFANAALTGLGSAIRIIIIVVVIGLIAKTCQS